MIFYQVIRVFFIGESETHSVQFFDDLIDAQKRFFNIIAADLANENVTYQAAYIIASNGMMMEQRIFDRRTTESEGE